MAEVKTWDSYVVTLLSMVVIFVFSKATVCHGLLSCDPMDPRDEIPVYEQDIDMLRFAENLEFLEAELYRWAASGYGLDHVAPELAMGGPPPIGGQKANLDPLTLDIINEFANQEVGHLRVLRETVGLIPRPLIDLSAKNFAKLFDEAFGHALEPPFDPYRDGLSFMMGAYVVPYMGLVAYVGTNPSLLGFWSRRVLAGLLGVEGGQDAVIRTYLYERAREVVQPYNHTVGEFTIRISNLRNNLAMCGIKDEGIFVPPELGAENRTISNVLSADYYSISYRRTPGEVLRVLYNSGDEHIPGGFYPVGGNGRVARQFLE